MTGINTGVNNQLSNLYKNPSPEGEVSIVLKKAAPPQSNLRSSDTSSFINSAFLIDISEEAKTMSAHAQLRHQMNEIVNNWRELRAAINEDI